MTRRRESIRWVPTSEGVSYHDICRNGPQCPVCSLWAMPGESVAEWHARLRALYQADESATHRERVSA